MSFKLTQSDTSPVLGTTLRDGSMHVDITGYNEVRFHMQNEYDEVVISDNTGGRVNVVDADRGKVEYVFTEADTRQVGTYDAEWQVEYSDGTVETFPTDGYITIEILEGIA